MFLTRRFETWGAVPEKTGSAILGPTPSVFTSEVRLALQTLGLEGGRRWTFAEVNRELRGRALDKRQTRAVETLRRCLK